jgi:hypothetical protein
MHSAKYLPRSAGAAPLGTVTPFTDRLVQAWKPPHLVVMCVYLVHPNVWHVTHLHMDQLHQCLCAPRTQWTVYTLA